MKNIKIIFIAFSVLVLSKCNCQIIIHNTTDKNTVREGLISLIIYNERVTFKFDYFGELVLHPGLNFGIDYTQSSKKWVTFYWDMDLGLLASMHITASGDLNLPIKKW